LGILIYFNDKSMLKVLVTGSNGLLGQKLIYQLLSENNVTPLYEIFAASRGNNRLINQSGYSFISLDITSKEEVKNVLSNIKPDCVIHTAAMTNVDACELDPINCELNNFVAVKYIVNTLEELNETDSKYQPHLIHLSTDFVFDGKSGPYLEDDKPNPISIYGKSKLDAEDFVRSSKLNWCIVRTIIVYGMVDNMSRSNLVLWAINALKKGEPIKVVNDQFRSPTLAEDLAEGCLLAMKMKASGIFNISGSGLYSVLDLVHIVANEFGLNANLIQPIASEQLNQAAKRPPKTGFILNKAKEILNYQPKSFEEGVRFFKTQLETYTDIHQK